MAEIKFGRSQRKKPTPDNVIFWVRVISIIAGVLMLWMPTASFIPRLFQDIATSLCGLIIALSNALSPLFGVNTNEKEIPIGEVTAMETKPDLSSLKAAAPGDNEIQNK